MGRDWLGELTHCFLIRHPREVITSYLKKHQDPTLEDLGFVQQEEIFDWVRAHNNQVPPVLDAEDVLNNPEATLRLLCQSLGVPFLPAMLSWEAGLRPTDGVWAKYWYAEVETSTSFRPYQPKADPVPDRLRGVYEQCLEAYQRLYEFRLHGNGNAVRQADEAAVSRTKP